MCGMMSGGRGDDGDGVGHNEAASNKFAESVWITLYHSLEACYYTSLLPLRFFMVCTCMHTHNLV